MGKLEKISAWNLTKVKSKKKVMARRMGSPRQVSNRRRRTREGPEPACVQTPLSVGVARVSGRHVVRGRQSSPIPAQQPAVYRWQ